MKTYLITTKDSYGETNKRIVNAHSEGEAIELLNLSEDTRYLQIEVV